MTEEDKKLILAIAKAYQVGMAEETLRTECKNAVENGEGITLTAEELYEEGIKRGKGRLIHIVRYGNNG